MQINSVYLIFHKLQLVVIFGGNYPAKFERFDNFCKCNFVYFMTATCKSKLSNLKVTYPPGKT